MGFVGIPLSVATFPVEVIALGIAVDDTIHFMTRFSQEIKLTSDNREAIEPHACARSSNRCSTTSVALVIGFSMLCFGQFASTKQFGFLAALTMAVAWFSDLMITPMLLHATPLITAWDLLRLKIGDAGGPAQPPLPRPQGVRGQARGAARHRHQARRRRATCCARATRATTCWSCSRARRASRRATPRRARTREIGKVEPGDVVGEVAFFTSARRTASVVATEDGEYLRIDAPRMRRVAQRFPKIAAKVYANLAQLLGAKVERTTLQIFEQAS